MRFAFLFAIAAFGAINCSAQTIYVPVQFEFGQARKYYYGGNDPTVFTRAERTSRIIEATNRYCVAQPIRTYTDTLPFQSNAAIFGFTANDAKNEAYQAQPRYFRTTSGVRPVSRSPDVSLPSSEAGAMEIKPFIRPTQHQGRVIIVDAGERGVIR